MCWLSRFLKPLSLSHPEEPPDYSQTINTVNIDSIIAKWLANYFVPLEYRNWWKDAIVITLTNDISSPAQTWEDSSGERHLDIRPEYLNCGVIAHEQAHNSYSLMTNEQRISFSSIYTPLKSSDSLIKLLYSKNTYGLVNDIEGHAEIYRYLGNKMPSALKTFYPRLF